MSLQQDVFIAALAEAGYPGSRPSPDSDEAILVPPWAEPPCGVIYKAADLSRRAVGAPLLSIEEWHEFTPPHDCVFGLSAP